LLKIVIHCATESSPLAALLLNFKNQIGGKRLMQLVRTLRLVLVLGLAGFGGGCGPGASGPISQEEGTQIKESKKKAHQQAKEEDVKTQATQRRAAHRGPAGP
jgi:hypothetical protein